VNQCLTPPAPKQKTPQKREDIRDLLQTWDRAAYGIACRQIEILLLHGENEKAIGVLRGVIRRQSRAKPTLGSPLGDLLPIRIANMLEDGGYHTLAACDRASDAELLALKQCGPAAVELIRETVLCVVAGRPLPAADDFSDLEPDWELTTTLFQTEGDRIVSQIEEALKVLLDSGDGAVREIDAKIARLTSEIENLKRMRKLLSPMAPQSNRLKTDSAKADWAQLSKTIAQVIREKGPLRAKEIGTLIGADYAHVGRIVRQFPDVLTKSPDGLIALADAA
jgi:hypothetical protein